jgi:DNA polymerase I
LTVPNLYLIDAHAYLHRAYHALPPMNNSQGQPVNAVLGFLRMTLKINRQYKPDAVAVCFDSAAPTFRHEAFAEYKGTRKEIDEALISQFPLAREAIAALGLASFEKDGFEADDIIAYLTRQARAKGWDVVIVSGDKDALQLVGDGVTVLNEPKNILYDAPKVVERYGVSPKQLIEVFSLMGDAVDNIPGVAGIGEKTAVKLIQEHGDLESLLKAAPTIKGKVGTLLQEQAESARKSHSLVILDKDVPLEIDWEALKLKTPRPELLTPFLQKMEFFSLLRELLPTTAGDVDTSQRDYKTLVSEKSLREWIEEARRAERLAIDVETDSLNPLSAHLVGISMSFKPGSARYIPIAHRSLNTEQQLSLETVQKYLAPLLQGSTPRVYGHNLKFDSLILARHGLPVQALYCDTMVASYVLNPSRNSHGLKDLVHEMVGERMTPIEALIGKGAKQITMDEVPVETAAPYACADADMSLRLAEKFEAEIKTKELEKLFYEMEMPLVSILGQMETHGIRVDRFYLQTLGEAFKTRGEALEKMVYEQAGETFNINSPKQLAVILFEKMKLPILRRTKTGISTDEEVLQKLSVHHPLPKTLMEYRELQKLRSTYIDGLQTALGSQEERIHTSFNQTVAATGRLSSSGPNLQNIPIRTELGRQIRKAFVAEPEHTLLSADYSQIDLRMLAHISADPILMEAFRRGEDVHTTTASEIFEVAREEVSADLRRMAKSINFGIVYGISAFGLSQQLQIPVEEARQHIKRYFERYPGVASWIEKTLQEARINGYVRTLLGRIRYLPEILSKNSQIRGFAERMAMNTPIQGTSADVIKLAMIRVAEAISSGKLPGRMLVQVHDELLFEVPDTELQNAAALIKPMMEQVVPLSIPVVVDFKYGKNWSEMTPMKNGAA